MNGCSQNGQTNNNQNDTISLKQNNSLILLKEKSSDSLSAKILGVWTDGSTENATFDIGKDTIFYVDQLEGYKYFINKDSIRINYSDWTYTGKIRIEQDTLILSSEDGISKYWKFKK